MGFTSGQWDDKPARGVTIARGCDKGRGGLTKREGREEEERGKRGGREEEGRKRGGRDEEEKKTEEEEKRTGGKRGGREGSSRVLGALGEL